MYNFHVNVPLLSLLKYFIGHILYISGLCINFLLSLLKWSVLDLIFYIPGLCIILLFITAKMVFPWSYILHLTFPCLCLNGTSLVYYAVLYLYFYSDFLYHPCSVYFTYLFLADTSWTWAHVWPYWLNLFVLSY